LVAWARSDAPPAHGDARAQVAQMMGSYATEEQRRNHQGLAVEAIAPQAVTFF